MRLPHVADLLALFVPHTCGICRRPLVDGERLLCLACQAGLPRLHDAMHDNEAEHRVFGRMAFEHGASFCYYERSSDYARLLRDAKYGSQPWIDTELARLWAVELTPQGWPWDVDVIVPVPTHWWRRLRRGYNQSEAVARGLGEVWGLPVERRCLYKSRYTGSQVGRSFHERLGHMDGTFAVRRHERLRGRHVLVVDDVLTSGATLVACAAALHEVDGVRVSFLTLGLSN